ncbi:MAG: hypothetical protein ACJ73D_10090 [Pyrinomonadaceae bacterium]
MLPYELNFQERNGYLYAHVTAGDIDRDTALDYLKKVTDSVTDSRFDRLMVERDIPVMMSSIDLFFTTQDFLKMIGPTRVAFVNRHATIHSEMEFAMLIGTNRGANYRLFSNETDAELWLLSDGEAKL